ARTRGGTLRGASAAGVAGTTVVPRACSAVGLGVRATGRESMAAVAEEAEPASPTPAHRGNRSHRLPNGSISCQNAGRSANQYRTSAVGLRPDVRAAHR